MSVHAYATIKVRVRCKSNWNSETVMKQIRSQAKEDALETINGAINHHSMITLMGEPVITTVMAEDDE